MTKELKQELTTKDLARMFGVTRQSIFNWRKIGLEFYKIGGNGLADPTRYSLDPVLDFAKSKGKVVVNHIYES